MTIFSAYITNLGKYNEGELLGKWHDFPTTKEEVQKTLKEIGIDGRRYEEFFITDYDCEVGDITANLGEYENIDELNYLATKLDELSKHEWEIYEAALGSGEYSGSIQNLINLTENLDCYDYLSGIENDWDIGNYWIEESGCYDMKDMGQLANYIDYERFGRDIRLEEGGTFTYKGYVRCNGESFYEDYDGRNVPDEYKVFAMPKPQEKVTTKAKPNRDRGAR